jgi:aryl-alcohol dehydrogenase-like predicted oxidoreductase
MLPIPGTSRVDHLEENVATAAVKIDDGIFQELSKLAGKGR